DRLAKNATSPALPYAALLYRSSILIVPHLRHPTLRTAASQNLVIKKPHEEAVCSGILSSAP
ncbi:hypothetical protein, partial [Escherichia coli]|uniref:hypothetical protein n=1 Tax=Escherichia coli TaxID=562 RepID=UPI001BC95537